MKHEIIVGDCMDVIKDIPEKSIASHPRHTGD